MRYIRYEIWNVASAREWDFTLVVLRNCAPQREQDHWTYIYYRVEVLRVVGSRSSHDTKNVSSKCVGHTQQSGSSKTITSVWRYSGEHYSVLRDFNVWIFSTITTVRFGFSRFYRPKPLPPHPWIRPWVTWPKHRSWDRYIGREVVRHSGFYEFHSCCALARSVTPWTLRKNPISAVCGWDSALSAISQDSWP